MKKQQVIDLILENGCASQKYIVKRDILSAPNNLPEMKALQEDIIKSKNVQRMLKVQDENGWIGDELHGRPGKAMDSSIDYLIDLGVEPTQPFMQHAKHALLIDANPDPRKNIVHGTFIRGYNFSRCMLLGELYTDGTPEEELVSAQKRILDIFKMGINIKSLDDVSRLCTRKKYIGSRANLKDKLFPWPSDMIVLSSCLTWKSKETTDMMTKSLQNISTFMPIPTIFEVVNGYYLAPICSYSYFSHADCTNIKDVEIIFWFRDYNRLCKVCNIKEVPYFYKQALILKKYVEDDNLIENLSEKALKYIEAAYGYSGKWKSELQRKVDVYFKALIILHNANIEF